MSKISEIGRLIIHFGVEFICQNFDEKSSEPCPLISNNRKFSSKFVFEKLVTSEIGDL